MGEPEHRIYVIGSPALDKFRSTPRLSKSDLLNRLGRPAWRDFAVTIYHPPILGQERESGRYLEHILQALKDEGIPSFVSYPNTDPGHERIIQAMRHYQDNPNFRFYRNLDRSCFINLLRHAALMIGNSSAGLLEAPSIPLGVVNIGIRQTGRLAATNVVFVRQDVQSIRMGIRRVCSETFQRRLRHVRNPYGDGRSVERAIRYLKTLRLGRYLRKTEDPLTL
jgi:GDP/UDP-N,N'-diacetylbacillosamine 2-epimerase (hydrolysing)